MILNKIILKNFRQFYGEQEIIFSRGGKNITIVLGENGTGKTGIFRALIFSLFGEIYIEQDNPDDDLHIVNFKAIEENSGKPTNAWVTIEFENENKQYRLKREITAIQRNNKINERENGIELYITDENGNFLPEPKTDPYEVNNIVYSIVDDNTKDFFFFDGEQIDTLAKTDESVKKEVKNGIVKLLKIDEVKKAIDILTNLSRNEKTKITKEAKNLDLTNKKNESEQIEKDIEASIELTTQREAEVVILKEKIKELESQLNQSNEINDLIQRKQQIDDKIKLQKQLVSSKKDNIRKILLDNGANFLLSDYYIDVNNYLDQVAADQDDLVSIIAINKTLNDNKCVICGTNLIENPEHKHNVELLQENYKSDELTPLISLVQGAIADYRKNEEEYKSEMKNAFIEFTEIKNGLEQEQRQLENINDEIKDAALSETSLADLQSELDEKNEELSNLLSKINSEADKIERLKKDKKVVDKEFEKLMSQNKSLRIDQQVLSFINRLNDEMNIIFEEYSNDMRVRLSNETTNIFKSLISEKDRDLINRININEKYEIEVIGWDEVNITPDISQGQRQIVSLAFITALSKVATKIFKSKSFPLFMDTPFGRISGENRDQLIQNIPTLTSQWILLLTDTELTAHEERVFKDTEKLGNSYRLNQIHVGHTVIEKIAIRDSIATRGY